jgi:hypothetical protein
MVSDPTPRERAAHPRPSEADVAPLAAAQDRMSGGMPGGYEDGLPVRARLAASSLLGPGEVVVLAVKPSHWYVLFAGLPFIAAGLSLVFLAFVITDLPLSVRQAGVILGVSIVGFRFAWAILQWFSRTYVLTDRRILVQEGVVDVDVRFMGLEEIESTFVAQAAAQHMLGIGTLFFRSLRSASSMAWEHIAKPAEIHAEVILQIDRWKRCQQMTKQA